MGGHEQVVASGVEGEEARGEKGKGEEKEEGKGEKGEGKGRREGG